MTFVVFTVLLVLSVLILLFDLLIGGALVITLARAVPLARRGQSVTGHVVTVERQRPGRQAQVRVAYETPAGTLETMGRSQNPRIGEPRDVRYDPARPARATTIVRPGRTAAGSVPMVLIVAAVAAGMITGSVWYFAGAHSHAQLPLGGGCFMLALALVTGYYVAGRCAVLLHWRRMAQVPGTVKRFDEHAPGGPGLLVSFPAAGGREEFWARAGSVVAGVGDTVTVRFDPAKPATSATVQGAADIRAQVIGAGILTLLFAAVAVAAFAAI